MAPERELELLALVAEALQRSPEGRIEFLRQRVQNDDLAMAEAASLLAYQNRVADQNATISIGRFAIGDLLANRFRIAKFLGQGGMGAVYEAEDTEFAGGRRVALKVIRPEISGDERVLAQFKREIRIGQTITHPNVCRIFDLGVHQGQQGKTGFLTMELLDGESLAQRLRRTGALPLQEALKLIQQMSDALHAAHRGGYVHRDFKPANVMLVPASNTLGQRAVVTDFGLAMESQIAGMESRLGMVAGTPDYMSPEQVEGHPVGPSSDIYALGIVVYELVTGKLPFPGESNLIRMVKRLHEDPLPPEEHVAGLKGQWSEAILHCLERSPEKRFRSAPEFVRALESRAGAVAGGSNSGRLSDQQSTLLIPASSIDKASETVRPLPDPMKKRTRLLPYGLAALVLLALSFALLHWRNWLHPLPHAKRIAILSLHRIGEDPRTHAFSDGLIEILASRLTQLESAQGVFSVVPMSEILSAKVISAREAKREFDATLVVTGSVQPSTGGFLLTIVLIDPLEEKQLRSQDIFVVESDLVEMEERVVTQVSSLLELGVPPAAIERTSQGNTKVPGAVEFYVRGSGYLLAGNDKLGQAIAELRRAIELDSRYALAHSALGQAYWSRYLSTKDTDWIGQAWAECNQAIELNGSIAPPHVTLARLESGRGHYKAAIAQARLAIGIDPENFQAYSEIARALEATGHVPEAETTLKQAISLRPDYWGSYHRLAKFYFDHGRYQEAESQFLTVMKLVPDNPDSYTNLGVMYHMEGRNREAESMLNKSLQLRPTVDAASNLATVYFFEGRYGAAVPIMEDLAKQDPRNYIVVGNLADDYRWTPGDEEKALQTYAKAISLVRQALNVNPEDIEALSALGLYLSKSGQREQALAAAAKCLTEAGRDAEVLFDSAVIYEISGLRDDSLQMLRRAVKAGYSADEIAADPELSNLRRDPRYTSVIRKSGGK